MKNSNLLTLSTIKLDVITPEGTSTGTGFLYRIMCNKRTKEFILTNKHIVEDGISINMRFSISNKDGKGIAEERFDYTFRRMKAIVHHPNPSVDLCAIPISQVFNSADRKRISLKTESFSSYNLPKKEEIEEVNAIEEIFMAGYPNGIMDKHNNTPIVTRGITATELRKNFNGKKEFLMDINGHNGNSGAPIIMVKYDDYYRRNNVSSLEVVLLLGVAYSGYDYSRTFTIEKDESTKAYEYEIGSSLMVALKSDRIRELECLIKRQENRKLAA